MSASDKRATREEQAAFEQDNRRALDSDFNDIGNAERFAEYFVKEIAYVPEIGIWRRWTGTRWLDDNDEAMRNAQAIARAWFDDLANEPDGDRRKRIFQHAQRSASVNSLRAMLDIARTRGLTVPLGEWDAQAMLLGTRNGVVNLVDGQPIDADPLLRISKCAAADFEPDAKAPTWSAFLDRIFDGDVALIEFVQRAAGYSLTGDATEQCFFICYGTGANGKSTLLRVLRELVGDYGRSCEAESLLSRQTERINNDIARLAGARLVTAIETVEGRRLAENLVKALTGGDMMTARFLHREYFEFEPCFKLWLGTNHKPIIRDDSHAMWRRVRLIPFAVTIPPEERDGRLPARLAAEAPGILNWAIQGCLSWQRYGLEAPSVVMAATEAYRHEMDHVGQWIDERCVLAPTTQMQITPGFRDYQQWAEARGERAMTMTALGRKLSERFRKETIQRVVTYFGLGLAADVQGLQGLHHETGIFSYTRSREKRTGNGLQTPATPANDDGGRGETPAEDPHASRSA